jgi:hypothetical protein
VRVFQEVINTSLLGGAAFLTWAPQTQRGALLQPRRALEDFLAPSRGAAFLDSSSIVWRASKATARPSEAQLLDPLAGLAFIVWAEPLASPLKPRAAQPSNEVPLGASIAPPPPFIEWSVGAMVPRITVTRQPEPWNHFYGVVVAHYPFGVVTALDQLLASVGLSNAILATIAPSEVAVADAEISSSLAATSASDSPLATASLEDEPKL